MNRRVFYWAVAIFGLTAGILFTFGIFAADGAPSGWRVAKAGIGAVFLFGAYRAFGALYGRIRVSDRLNATGKRVLGMARVGCAIAAAIRFFAGGAAARGVATDLLIISGVMIFLGYCLQMQRITSFRLRPAGSTRPFGIPPE